MIKKKSTKEADIEERWICFVNEMEVSEEGQCFIAATETIFNLIDLTTDPQDIALLLIHKLDSIYLKNVKWKREK